MKRIIKVLVVSALMVVLMATTVSPAFAGTSKPYGHPGNGWGVDGYNGGCDDYNPKSEGWKWGKCTNIDYSN